MTAKVRYGGKLHVQPSHKHIQTHTHTPTPTYAYTHTLTHQPTHAHAHAHTCTHPQTHLHLHAHTTNSHPRVCCKRHRNRRCCYVHQHTYQTHAHAWNLHTPHMPTRTHQRRGLQKRGLTLLLQLLLQHFALQFLVWNPDWEGGEDCQWGADGGG